MPRVADFTSRDVQTLRKEAGVGMMDAKNALVETKGDHEAALELLRERGLVQVAKRAERTAHHGTIGYYIHHQAGRPVTGVLVDLACETDFVAKSDEFVEAANDIAMHVSWGKPRWVTRDEVAADELEARRAEFAAEAAEEGKPDDIIPKIVEGKVEKFLADNALADQTFVNPDKFDGTVGEMVTKLAAKMGENVSVRRMARLAVEDVE